MIDNGYDHDFAERTFRQLEGFGSYGFPESHAASFALIAYASSWLKCHHPDVFLAAILNAQPMGFYAPAQLVRDAREHGVEVRPVDVNHSQWDCTLEPVGNDRHAVRLGFRVVRGLPNLHGARIPLARGGEPYSSLEDLWRRAQVPVASLRRLASADTYRSSLGLSRREALWAIRGLRDEPLPLFAAADAREGAFRPELDEEMVQLAPMTAGREVVEDYRAQGLSLRQHPVAFLRGDLAGDGYVCCSEVATLRNRSRVLVGGLVLIRQKPGSAKGVMFITLEDETSIANLIVWPKLYERQRRIAYQAGMMGVRGYVQHQGGVTHITAEHLIDLTPWLRRISDLDETFPLATGRRDEARHDGRGASKDHGSFRPDGQREPSRKIVRDSLVPDRVDRGLVGSCEEEDSQRPGIRIRTRDFR
jgi:error-prone DNA polymerase